MGECFLPQKENKYGKENSFSAADSLLRFMREVPQCRHGVGNEALFFRFVGLHGLCMRRDGDCASVKDRDA
jgi:hypothetical protein